jgi:membrane protease YdiL (CAAX protease family)
VSFVTSELARVSGPVALLLIGALVFGETAVFRGFVIPGERSWWSPRWCSGRSGGTAGSGRA